jgi:hypothetical protein
MTMQRKREDALASTVDYLWPLSDCSSCFTYYYFISFELAWHQITACIMQKRGKEGARHTYTRKSTVRLHGRLSLCKYKVKDRVRSENQMRTKKKKSGFCAGKEAKLNIGCAYLRRQDTDRNTLGLKRWKRLGADIWRWCVRPEKESQQYVTKKQKYIYL